MNYVNITIDNIDSEHLCCAIADKKHQEGVNAKKEWLRDKINNGHVFRKLDAKGKIFIEYDDLEKSWVPIIGEGYLYIYCLWVAGSFKGNGHAKDLLEYAIDDAKKRGKKGLCLLSSKKKKPFLSEKSFFVKYGFKCVDAIDDFELLALSFEGEVPQFRENAKKMAIESDDLTIFYTSQCPYTNNCIVEIKEFGEEKNMNIVFKKIETLEDAQNMPCVFNNWAVFYKKKYLTNCLLNKNSIEKLIKE